MITFPSEVGFYSGNNHPSTGTLNTEYRFDVNTYSGDVKPVIALRQMSIIPMNLGLGEKEDDSCLKKVDYNGFVCAPFSKIGLLSFEALTPNRVTSTQNIAPVSIQEDIMDVDAAIKHSVNSYATISSMSN